MAEPRKVGKKWRIEIQVRGQSLSSYHDRKADATAWAVDMKKPGAKIKAQSNRIVRDIFDRYAKEVSPTKGGKRWEELRLNAISKMDIAQVRLEDLGPRHCAAWRDERLASVKAGTVLREMNLVGHAFTVAVKEWEWMEVNPFSSVKRPETPAPRDKTYTPDEVEQIIISCGTDLSTVMGRVGAAFLFALETGMREGEIAALAPENIFPVWVFCEGGKTAAARRVVPLTPVAVKILAGLPKFDDGTVFGLTARQIDANFRKASQRTLVKGKTFHDARHNAATTLAKQLTVMELAKSLGIKDLKTLQNVYYNPTPEDLAAKLRTGQLVIAPQPPQPPG